MRDFDIVNSLTPPILAAPNCGEHDAKASKQATVMNDCFMIKTKDNGHVRALYKRATMGRKRTVDSAANKDIAKGFMVERLSSTRLLGNDSILRYDPNCLDWARRWVDVNTIRVQELGQDIYIELQRNQ